MPTANQYEPMPILGVKNGAGAQLGKARRLRCSHYSEWVSSQDLCWYRVRQQNPPLHMVGMYAQAVHNAARAAMLRLATASFFLAG